MNPYEPTLSIDSTSVSVESIGTATGLNCPVCHSNRARLLHRSSRRRGRCPDCGTELRKVLPLWVSLSTVLSYLSGFLLFALIQRLGIRDMPYDFWETYFYAATLLFIIPHMISAMLYHRNCRFVVET